MSEEFVERIWRPLQTWQTHWSHYRIDGGIRLSTRQRYIEGREPTHEPVLIEDVVLEEIPLALEKPGREVNYPVLKRRR